MSDAITKAANKHLHPRSLAPHAADIANGPMRVNRDTLRVIMSFVSAKPPLSIPEAFSLRAVNRLYCEQIDDALPSITRKIRQITERNILNNSLDMGRVRALYKSGSFDSPRLISSYLQMLFKQPDNFCHIYVYPSDLSVLSDELFDTLCNFIAGANCLKSFSLHAEQGQQLSTERTLQLIRAIKANTNIKDVSWCISFKQAQNGPLMRELSGKELSLTDYIWAGGVARKIKNKGFNYRHTRLFTH